MISNWEFENSEFRNSESINSEFENSEFENSEFENWEFVNLEFESWEFEHSESENSVCENLESEYSEYANSEFEKWEFENFEFENSELENLELKSERAFFGLGSGPKKFFGTYLCRQATLVLEVQLYIFFNLAPYGFFGLLGPFRAILFWKCAVFIALTYFSGWLDCLCGFFGCLA